MVQKGLSRGFQCASSYALSLFLLSIIFLLPIKTFADGWTPTDGGLVVNLQPGDQFMLSVMVGDKEYFVCDYKNQGGGDFNYGTGNFLKLFEQPNSTDISPASIWTVDTALTRVINKIDYALGGIAYTMKSANNQTLIADGSNKYLFTGILTSSESTTDNKCDVVFVQPTDNIRTSTFDPNNTMNRGTKFNGAKGFGHAGLPYREVYWLEFAR